MDGMRVNEKEFMDEWYEGLTKSRKAGLERSHQHHLGLLKCFGRMFSVKVDDEGQVYTNQEWKEALKRGGSHG